MLRESLHRLLDQLTQMALAVHVIWPRVAVFELQRPFLILPVLLDRLKQHERIARPVAQLVLRQVRRDGVDPRRELFRAVEPMQVPVNPDEHFLHEVFGLLAIADRSVYEVQQPSLIPLD
jgi:hypothetical protein